MATSPAVQVATSAIDLSGVSTATSAPSVGDPRAGRAYNPADYAAGAVLWAHPTHTGAYLIINAQRWSGATPVGGDPGAYSDYTVDTNPSWYVLDGPSGQRTAVPNDPVDIPMLTPATNVTVTAAASRPPQYLWLLNAVKIDGVHQAVLQYFQVSYNGAVTHLAEEVLPTPGTVVFNKGLQYDTPYLYVYGTDASNNVYRIRKLWAKVGFNKQLQIPLTTVHTLIGNQVGWEYYTGTGYDTDPTTIGPVSGLTTVGSMSFASLRNKWLISTVQASGALRSAQFYLTKSARPLTAVGDPIALGSTSIGSYLGLGAQLQPQLTPNPAAFPTGVSAGVPYVISTRTGTSGAYTLENSWNIHGWPS